jgi:hypothetical protein
LTYEEWKNQNRQNTTGKALTYQDWKGGQQTSKPKDSNMFSGLQKLFTGIKETGNIKPRQLVYNPEGVKTLLGGVGTGMEAAEKLHEPILALPPVKTAFDVLQRGQYVSANTAKKIAEGKPGEIPEAIIKGITGEEKGSFQDVVPKNAPNWVKGTVGFIGDIALDPTTYITGGISKVGKLKQISKGLKGLDALQDVKKIDKVTDLIKAGTQTADIVKKANVSEDVVNLIAKSQKPISGHKARQVINAVKNKTIDGKGLAETLTEQAAKGERGLFFNIPFTNKQIPLAPNKALYKAGEKAGQKLKGSEQFQSLWKLFNRRPFMPTKEEAALFDLTEGRRRQFETLREDAVQTGRDLMKLQKDIEKKYGVKAEKLFDIAEQAGDVQKIDAIVPKMENGIPTIDLKPTVKGATQETTLPAIREFSAATEKIKQKTGLKELPQEIQDYVSKVRDLQQKNLELEKLAGVPTQEFISDELSYMRRVPTKEAKEVLKKTGPVNIKTPIATTKAGYQKGRGSLRDTPVSEINELAQTGQLKITKGKKIKFFVDDPSVAQTIRNVESAKVQTNAKFLDNILANPSLASKGKNIPEGFRAIKYPHFFDEKGNYKIFDPFNGKLKGYKFHPEAAKEIEKTFVLGEKGPIEKAIDTVTNLGIPIGEGRKISYNAIENWWKKRALASPGTVVRNVMGNITNPLLVGTTPKEVGTAYKILRNQAGTIETALGKKYSFDEVRKLLKEKGVTGTGWYSSDIQEAITDQLKGPGKKVFNPLSSEFGLVRGTRKMNESMEDLFRTNVFIDQLKKGYSPDDAAKNVNKVLFDYTDLTDFERQVKKFLPFYTWTRKNIPLQAANLVKQPGKYAAIPKGTRAVQEGTGSNEIPSEAVSEWMLQNLPVKIGKDKVFLLKNWLPQGDIADLLNLGRILEKPSEMVSPVAGKLATELLTNKSAAFNTPIEKIPGEKDTFLGLSMPKKLAYFLKSDRPLNDVDKLFFRNDLPALDRAFGYLTGGKLYGIDQKKGISWAMSTIRDEIEMRNSALGRYNRELKNPKRTEKDKETIRKNIEMVTKQRDELVKRYRKVNQLYTEVKEPGDTE